MTVSLHVREGTRVFFEPTPVSYALYSKPPRRGMAGTVTSVSFGGSRRTYLPGPGGGLVYVKWDDGSFQGVSSLDLVKLSGSKLKANPGDGGLSALGTFALIGAAALGIGWLVMSEKKAAAAEAPTAPTTPSVPTCPSAAQVKAFAYSKSLSWFTNPTPPTAPPTNAQWTPDARVYSESDCTFYKWAFGLHMFHWEKDVALTNELRAAQLQQAMQGVSAVHPFMGALPPSPT